MQKRTAFTLIELLVVVAIIALLVSILVPALNEARAVAKRSICAGNIHSLVVGVHLYYNDAHEIPDRSNYAWGYAPNYMVLGPPGMPDPERRTANTGDFSVMYPDYVDTPDAYYCPDGSYFADDPGGANPGDTRWAFNAPWHGITGRYMTYAYLGRWDASPHVDINGDKVEIAESLADASPEAVLITEDNWYDASLNLYSQGTHPPILYDLTGYGIRDGTNTGRADGSVVWVNEEDTIPRLYKHHTYWLKY